MSNAKSRIWTRTELLAALDLYFRTPFGLLHNRNPEIRSLAKSLGRTPGAVAMKLGNFASFDPTLRARGVKGLKHGSKQDRDIWNEFCHDSESFAVDASLAARSVSMLVGPTETTRPVRIRLVQSFFRDAVLTSYDSKCAFCGLAVPTLLNGSHIIPWSIDKARRADPRNGLALCTLHDRAFDRGLVTVLENLSIVLAKVLKKTKSCGVHREAFTRLEGKKMTLPHRFAPDPRALEYHRDNIFQFDS